jgi:hypothetical protein
MYTLFCVTQADSEEYAPDGTRGFVRSGLENPIMEGVMGAFQRHIFSPRTLSLHLLPPCSNHNGITTLRTRHPLAICAHK